MTTFKPSDIADIWENPNFGALSYDERWAVLENIIAGASDYARAAPDYDAEVQRTMNQLIDASRAKLGSSESIGEKGKWAAGVAGQTVVDSAKVVVATAADMGVTQDNNQTGEIDGKLPLENVGKGLWTGAQGIWEAAGHGVAAITHREESKSLEAEIERLKAEIDDVKYPITGTAELKTWLRDRDAAMTEKRRSWIKAADTQADETAIDAQVQKRQLTKDPEILNNLVSYMRNRTPGSWDVVRRGLIETPTTASLNKERDMVKETPVGRALETSLGDVATVTVGEGKVSEALSGVKVGSDMLVAAGDILDNALVGLIPVGKGASMARKGFKQAVRSTVEGVAIETASEVGSLLTENPDATLGQIAETAKAGAIGAGGLTAAGAAGSKAMQMWRGQGAPGVDDQGEDNKAAVPQQSLESIAPAAPQEPFDTVFADQSYQFRDGVWYGPYIPDSLDEVDSSPTLLPAMVPLNPVDPIQGAVIVRLDSQRKAASRKKSEPAPSASFAPPVQAPVASNPIPANEQNTSPAMDREQGGGQDLSQSRELSTLPEQAPSQTPEARTTARRADNLPDPTGTDSDLISALKRTGTLGVTDGPEWNWYRQLETDAKTSPLKKQEAEARARRGELDGDAKVTLAWLNQNGLVSTEGGKRIDEAVEELTGAKIAEGEQAFQRFDVEAANLGDSILAAIDARVTARAQGDIDGQMAEEERLVVSAERELSNRFIAHAVSSPGTAMSGNALSNAAVVGSKVEIGGKSFEVVDVDPNAGTVDVEGEFGWQRILPDDEINVTAVDGQAVAEIDMSGVENAPFSLAESLSQSDMTQADNAAKAAAVGLPTEAGVTINAAPVIREALNKIAGDTKLNRMWRAIARALSQQSYDGVDLRVESDVRRNYAGYYLNDRGIREIGVNLRQVGRGQVDSVGTFLHEALHHATLAKIQDPQGEIETEAVQALASVVKRVKAYAAAQDVGGKFWYELSNVEEFVSALFTRQDFQDFLAGIPDDFAPKTAAGKFRSVLSEIMRVLAQLVTGKRIAKGSTLEQAMTATLALFDTAQRDVSARSFTMPDGAVLVPPGTSAASITAYHGTPHKVDKFTTAKIGTGEGAQAYGWGLYFAESRDVGEQYRRNLSALANNARTFENPLTIEQARKRWEQGLDVFIEGTGVVSWEPRFLDSQTPMYEPKSEEVTGNLYTVELLPDADEFLDWDKPLSEQSEKVKAILDKAGISEMLASRKSADFPDIPLNIYSELAWDMGEEKASKKLASLGIPGIRYLDGGSRGSGDGTRNYVIFDENLVKILQENGTQVGNAAFSPAEESTYLPQAPNAMRLVSARMSEASDSLREMLKDHKATRDERTVDGEPIEKAGYLVRRDADMEAIADEWLDDFAEQQSREGLSMEQTRAALSELLDREDVDIAAVLLTRLIDERGRDFGFDPAEVQALGQKNASRAGFALREWRKTLDPLDKLVDEANTKTGTEMGKALGVDVGKGGNPADVPAQLNQELQQEMKVEADKALLDAVGSLRGKNSELRRELDEAKARIEEEKARADQEREVGVAIGREEGMAEGLAQQPEAPARELDLFENWLMGEKFAEGLQGLPTLEKVAQRFIQPQRWNAEGFRSAVAQLFPALDENILDDAISRIDEQMRNRMDAAKRRAIQTFLDRLTKRKSSLEKDQRFVTFYKHLQNAAKLGILDSQVFADAFASAWGLNGLNPALIAQLRQTYQAITATNAQGLPVHFGMVRETMERRFIEAVNRLAPAQSWGNFIFNNYQARVLSSVTSILNQFSGVFRMLLPVDAVARSYRMGTVRTVFPEWWKSVSSLGRNLPLMITAIKGESLGHLPSQVASGYVPTSQQTQNITGKDRIRVGGKTFGVRTSQILRLVELWSWRTIRAAEGLTGIADAEAHFREVLTRHYIDSGMKPAAAYKQALEDIHADPAAIVAARQQAAKEQAAGDIGTGAAVLKRRTAEIIQRDIDTSLAAANTARSEQLTAYAQFKTMPAGPVGFAVSKAMAKVSGSQGPLSKYARFWFMFGRFLGHAVDQTLAYNPATFWATRRIMDSSNTQRLKLIKEVFGSEEAYNRYVDSRAAAGTAFLLAVGVPALISAMAAGDDEDPFFSVTGTAPMSSDAAKDTLRATGRWGEQQVRVGSMKFGYSQIPELAPLLGIIGNISDHIRFGKLLNQRQPGDREMPGKKSAEAGTLALGIGSDFMMSPIKRSTYRAWFDLLDGMMSFRSTGEVDAAMQKIMGKLTQPIDGLLRVPVVVDVDKYLRFQQGNLKPDGIADSIMRRIPFVHVGGEVFNAYGEKTPAWDMFSYFPTDPKFEEQTKKAALLNAQTGTVRTAPKSPELKHEDGSKRVLTQEELAEYQRLSGKLFTESLLKNEQRIRDAYSEGGQGSAATIVRNVSDAANKRAKEELGIK